MDVIQAHQAGHLNVVAQMGTSLTEPQLRLLTPRLTGRVVLALDADSAGQNATMRSLEVARQTLQADYNGRLSLDIRVLQLPGRRGPGRPHPRGCRHVGPAGRGSHSGRGLRH